MLTVAAADKVRFRYPIRGSTSSFHVNKLTSRRDTPRTAGAPTWRETTPRPYLQPSVVLIGHGPHSRHRARRQRVRWKEVTPSRLPGGHRRGRLPDASFSAEEG